MALHNSVFRVSSLLFAAGFAAVSSADVMFYGDQDVLGTGTYGSDPTAGATLEGLGVGSVTYATLIVAHGFPFSPEADDFQNTDQIYVSTNQTAFGDGYSQYANRKNGPQIFSLDYASLVPAGHVVTSLTLGIAADDFQRPSFGQSFEARINGTEYSPITTVLNTIDQTAPKVQFFSVGIDPTLLSNTNVLELSINQLGDGRDGWAVDYLSVGIATQAVPEPATMAALGIGALALARRRRTH